MSDPTEPDDLRSVFDPRHVRSRSTMPTRAIPQPAAPRPAPAQWAPGWPVDPQPVRQRIVPMSGTAACSFALGVLAFVTFGATGIPAIITGHTAMRTTRGGHAGGHGLACVGAMLGWLSIAGWLLLWAILGVGLAGSLRGVQ